ncbi:MAG: RNA polymerase-binding protein DksA [Gammaproteobacteria bacterium]|nr:RNA polymerase-binding protein DksA [Gammaproteobacteria bacterium]
MSERQSHAGSPQHGVSPYQMTEGEQYMNAEQQAHFRRILNAWRQELMEEVDRTVDHMKVDSVHCPDPNDRATQESDMDLELRTRERERKLLVKIEHTLKKLDEHDYGYCEVCGDEIGIRRLEARPTAELCINCKTKQEAAEHLYA